MVGPACSLLDILYAGIIQSTVRQEYINLIGSSQVLDNEVSLVHLLTGCEDCPQGTGGGCTMGIAFLEVLGNSAYKFGVTSSDFGYSARDLAWTFAHELGHNLGMEHNFNTAVYPPHILADNANLGGIMGYHYDGKQPYKMSSSSAPGGWEEYRNEQPVPNPVGLPWGSSYDYWTSRRDWFIFEQSKYEGSFFMYNEVVKADCCGMLTDLYDVTGGWWMHISLRQELQISATSYIAKRYDDLDDMQEAACVTYNWTNQDPSTRSPAFEPGYWAYKDASGLDFTTELYNVLIKEAFDDTSHPQGLKLTTNICPASGF